MIEHIQSRPTIPFGKVWCDICDKACDFQESAVHRGGDKASDEILRGGGAVLIRATCHGATADAIFSFENLRRMMENRKFMIVAFAPELFSLEKPVDQPEEGVRQLEKPAS